MHVPDICMYCDHNTCIYYGQVHACMHCGHNTHMYYMAMVHGTCMYYDHRACMYYGVDYRKIYRMIQSFFNIGGPAPPQTPLLPWGASPPRTLDLTARAQVITRAPDVHLRR